MNELSMMVVGVGALGRHHARILSQLDGVKLAGVADPREEIGRPIAEQHNTRWVADYRELIGEVDAATIVVPTSLHLPVAQEFLRQGKPVLIEKPLTASLSEAEFLVNLAEQHDTFIQVGHVERFNPAMQAARRVSGLPKYIRAERLSPFPFRSLDIGVVHDVLIHDLDLVLDLVGSEIVSVQAFATSILTDREDCVTARLLFESGCVADLTASRVNPVAKREMQIWSAIGCVNVDLQAREVTTYAPSETLRFGKSLVERSQEPGADIEQLKRDVFGKFIRVENPDVYEQDALTAELQEFADSVRGVCTPCCSGREGLAAVRAAELVLKAISAHQWGQPYLLREVA